MRADDVEVGRAYRVEVPAYPGPGEEEWVPELSRVRVPLPWLGPPEG